MWVTRWEDFDYKPLGNGQVRLTTTLAWDDPIIGMVVVNAGFECDLSSYWLTRPIFDRLGRCQRGAVLHDMAYRLRPSINGRTISKLNADRIYRQSIGADGVNVVGRWVRWLGVATLGWLPWLYRSWQLRNK